jgi:hypothetical protein
VTGEQIDIGYKLIAGGAIIVQIVVVLLLLKMRVEFATKAEHRHVNERLDRHSERLNNGDTKFQVIEERIRMLPTSDQMNALALQLAATHGELRVLAERLAGFGEIQNMVRSQVALMDEISRHLMAGVKSD